MEKLIAHPWPGNVRELRNFIERIYILTPTDFVDVHDLRFAGLAAVSGGIAGGFSGTGELDGDVGLEMGEIGGADGIDNFREARAKFEKEYLLRKISENKGNISKTAEAIGLERSYLHRKIKGYGIDVEEIV